MFKVTSKLTQVQGSYKASKYYNKYFNTHPHDTLGPAGACKEENDHGVHKLWEVKSRSLKLKKI